MDRNITKRSVFCLVGWVCCAGFPNALLYWAEYSWIHICVSVFTTFSPWIIPLIWVRDTCNMFTTLAIVFVHSPPCELLLTPKFNDLFVKNWRKIADPISRYWYTAFFLFVYVHRDIGHMSASFNFFFLFPSRYWSNMGNTSVCVCVYGKQCVLYL